MVPVIGLMRDAIDDEARRVAPEVQEDRGGAGMELEVDTRLTGVGAASLGQVEGERVVDAMDASGALDRLGAVEDVSPLAASRSEHVRRGPRATDGSLPSLPSVDEAANERQSPSRRRRIGFRRPWCSMCHPCGMPDPMTTAGLMRSLGLDVDGPVRWGSSPASQSPGVFVVETDTPLAQAPIDLAAVRRWLERVPDLRLDGERPTPNLLANRLASFWIAGQSLLYVGRTGKSLAARVAALYGTELGHRRPHPGGHWLKTLRDLPRLRVWWAVTEAHEEYEDALLGAFAERSPHGPAASRQGRACGAAMGQPGLCCRRLLPRPG